MHKLNIYKFDKIGLTLEELYTIKTNKTDAIEICFAQKWKKINKKVVSWYETNKLHRITKSLQTTKQRRKKDIESNIYQLKLQSINTITNELQNKILDLIDVKKQYIQLIKLQQTNKKNLSLEPYTV